MAEIALRDVTKLFPDGTRAVSSVDLDIPDGSLAVLVGPSGCGKTTLLRMVAGLEKVTSGEISIGGRVVNNVPPKSRDIAMVFQNYALYPHMSVYDNMAFGLKLRGFPKPQIKRRTADAASVLGLLDQMRKKPRMLSGGQRQRVAMGRAIVREPQAFLMDEPLSNLDAKLRVQMRAEIARLQHELGVTTIYVTHDQIEAMTLGDIVAVMRNGVVQQVAPPQELFERPHSLFVAAFIGSPAMNLVRAMLVRDGGVHVEFGGFRLPVPDTALAERPALADRIGSSVVLGIRPEDFRDRSLANGAPGSGALAVEVDLRETLGRDAYLHFRIAAPPVITDDVMELAADTDAAVLDELSRAASEHATQFVAIVPARSRAKEGERVELEVDTGALHFFDEHTGDAIYARQ